MHWLAGCISGMRHLLWDQSAFSPLQSDIRHSTLATRSCVLTHRHQPLWCFMFTVITNFRGKYCPAMHGNHINRSLREWHVGLLSNRSSSPAPAFIFPPPVNKDLSVCCMSHSRVSHSAGDFQYEWAARTHSLSHSFYICVRTINSVSLCLSRGGEVCWRSSCRFSAPWPESTVMRSENAQN